MNKEHDGAKRYIGVRVDDGVFVVVGASDNLPALKFDFGDLSGDMYDSDVQVIIRTVDGAEWACWDKQEKVWSDVRDAYPALLAHLDPEHPEPLSEDEVECLVAMGIIGADEVEHTGGGVYRVNLSGDYEGRRSATLWQQMEAKGIVAP
jgi:hypothetical protein